MMVSDVASATTVVMQPPPLQQSDPIPAAAAPAAAAAAPSPSPDVVLTGLPEQGVTTHDVCQYMTYFGPVQDVVLEPGSASALVYFRDTSSATFATMLSGGVLMDKVVRIRRATVDEAKVGALNPATTEQVAAAPASCGKYTPQTGRDVSVPTQLVRQAAQTSQTHPSQLWAKAREEVTRLALGTASLGVRVAHAIADAVSRCEHGPIHRGRPTRQQYDYTPTQPQWGDRPMWLRGP